MKTLETEIRRHLPTGGESRRLFHGRGKTFEGLEGVVVDVFSPVVLITLYTHYSDEWLLDLAALVRRELPQATAVLVQERYLRGAPSRLLFGDLPEQVLAVENELRFSLRLGDAQNVGFFPDMAIGRQLVRERSAGKKVLNLFSYTCSFSVAALAGGARQVVNLDMNRGALDLGRENHRLNGFDLRGVSFLSLELFRSISKLRKLGPFDLVVCDPPAAQGKSFTAEQHWPKLIRRLPELLAPQGEILACLNAPHLAPGYCQSLQPLLDFLPMDTTEIIKCCPLFSGVTDEDLQHLLGISRTREPKRGELLFSEGEEAEGFFIVGSGKVKVYKLSPEGKERILHIVHPCATFAEAAIFGNGRYPAYAEPLEKSKLVFFPKDDFLGLLHEHSQIAINMIGGLSRFLRQFTTQIEELTFKDVPARLARYLVELAGDCAEQVELPVSKAQLASNLGTVSETLSRTFRKMADEQIIEVRGKVIEILDRDRLEDLSYSYKE